MTLVLCRVNRVVKIRGNELIKTDHFRSGPVKWAILCIYITISSRIPYIRRSLTRNKINRLFAMQKKKRKKK